MNTKTIRQHIANFGPAQCEAINMLVNLTAISYDFSNTYDERKQLIDEYGNHGIDDLINHFEVQIGKDWTGASTRIMDSLNTSNNHYTKYITLLMCFFAVMTVEEIFEILFAEEIATEEGNLVGMKRQLTHNEQ